MTVEKVAEDLEALQVKVDAHYVEAEHKGQFGIFVPSFVLWGCLLEAGLVSMGTLQRVGLAAANVAKRRRHSRSV